MPPAAEAVAKGITDAGGTAVAIVTDVSDKAAVDRLFDETLERFGAVDVLVNNAGLTDTERHFLEGDEAWWDRIHAVNLKGSFLCGLRAAKQMAQRGDGVIINVSSGGATRAHRGNAAYDATKGGIEALTRAMAVDLAPYGVRVNGLIPGSIDTRGMSPDVKKERGEAIPMGRVGEPAGYDRRRRLPRLRRCRLRHRAVDRRRRRHPGGDALPGRRYLPAVAISEAALVGSRESRSRGVEKEATCGACDEDEPAAPGRASRGTSRHVTYAGPTRRHRLSTTARLSAPASTSAAPSPISSSTTTRPARSSSARR